ncbi:MAG: hypothetical protein ACHQ50_04915 [Fimbriimonadales bacterium]
MRRLASAEFPALPSITRVEAAIGRLLGLHVYVGAACVGFYIDDPGAAEVRRTFDVDVAVAVTNESDRVRLDDKLRQAGLVHDFAGPICRWTLDGLIVDVMPTDSAILGFANRWYSLALSGAEEVQIEGMTIPIPHVCTFLATKIEAFDGRGEGDFIMSSDFEDLVRVLDGCSFILSDSSAAPSEVTSFLSERFLAWLDSRAFQDGLAAHLLEEVGGRDRSKLVLERIAGLIAVA